MVALAATFTVPSGAMVKLGLLTRKKVKVSPVLVLGSVAASLPTTVPSALFSATVPPVLQAMLVGASLVSVTLNVRVALAELALPSLTVKLSVA